MAAAPSVPQRRKPPPPPVVTDPEEDEEEEEEEEESDEDSNSLRTYRFTDDDTSMVVKDFFSMFCHKFPQIVTVSQGQYGEIDLDTFCAGQVMYIHSYASQKRVIARDVRGRTFSIPVDYPLKFKVIISRAKEGAEQTLQEILNEQSLPKQVKFSIPPHVTFCIGPDHQKASDLSNLVLVDSYDETYMMANCINTKHIDPRSILVPVYLQDALLSIVTGIEGKSPDDWQKYQATLAEEMKAITVDIKLGNKDIAFYSDDSLDVEDNVYDYIEPKNFLRMSIIDDAGYGVITDDIYTPIDEDKVEGPPIPSRQTSKDKPATAKGGKTDKPEIPSRNKIPEAEQAKAVSDNAKEHGYENDIPRKEVAPFSIFKNIGHKKKHDSHEKDSDEPFSVKELNIDGFGKKMKQLKLDKYVSAFKKDRIDGITAQELTKDDLKSDYGFSAVEAIRMMNFITSGHIPK